MKTNDAKNVFLQLLIDSMRKSAAELEEFQLQLYLGKAEAIDKFEETKAKLKSFLHEQQLLLKTEQQDLKAALEDLQVQLALGKAESLELFLEQKKKLKEALHLVQIKLKEQVSHLSGNPDIQHELEKFLLKLEILELKYQRKKMQWELDAAAFRNKVKQNLDTVEDEVKKNVDAFSHELSEAYKHLKKAFLND